jgi:antibiotic biosynthesis monooxygenase (ABM) superfamily enzyme
MKSSRRTFVKNSTMAIVAVGASALPALANTTAQGSMMHQVFFWLKPGTTEQDRKRFREELKKLSQIKNIKNAFIGMPESTEKRDVVDNSFDYSITFMFDSVKEHDAYQVAPDHKVFIEKCQDLWARVQVYDIKPV